MADHTANPGQFTCPPDFTEVINTEGLCLEDIEDEDNELFVIQTPADVDLANLNDQQMFLNGRTTFHYDNGDGQEEIYESDISNALDKQIAKGHLILPKRSSMKLRAARKEFKGLVFVKKSVSVPHFNKTQDSSESVPVSVKVKKRFESFSSIDENNEKQTEKFPASDLLNDDTECSQGVRKKHRYLTQDVGHPENSQVKSKKKHKRDKRDKVAECIKSEILSGDERTFYPNEIASPRSIKNKNKNHRNVDPECVDARVLHADVYQENDASLQHPMQDVEHPENSPMKSKKKHKHDKRNKVAECIKTEILSGDERTFYPNEIASSRRVKHKNKNHRNVDPEFVDAQLLQADVYSPLMCSESSARKEARRTKKKKHHEVD